MSGVARAARSFVVLFTCLSVACSGQCGSRQAGSPPPAAVSNPVPIDAKLETPSVASTAPTSDQLGSAVDALLPRVPLERYDVEAQARSLGPSVDALFRFVRDEVRYEAYSGVLRDAHGTIAARAGNSFDRARLLARLLQTHGQKARFASCTLAPDRIDALFSRIFDGFQPPTVLADNGPATKSAFFTRVLTRARRDYPVIRAAVGDRLAGGAADARTQARKDIARHVWVQANVNGQWQDLDPAFADAEPGRAYCTPSVVVDAMPPDWFQRVTIRVVAERVDEGALKMMTPALEVTRNASDLNDREVFLLHVPAAARSGLLGVGGGSASNRNRWVPMLAIDVGLEVGQAVEFTEGATGGGLSDALGAADASAFVAEWLEIDLAWPDGRRETTRRALTDRATAAWRQTTTYNVDALRTLPRDSGGFLAPRAVHHLLFTAGPHNLRDYLGLVEVVAFADEELTGANAALVNQLLPMTARDFASLVWTDHVIVPSVNDDPRVRLYGDSPRLLIVSETPKTGGGAIATYDLRRDTIGGVARDASSDQLLVDRKLLYAALQGALEHEAVARDTTYVDGDPGAVASTSALLTPEGVTVLSASDLDRLADVARQPDTAARLRTALGQKHVSLLVVPRGGLERDRSGWWEVSAGGDARAVLGDDLNMSAADRPPHIPGPAETWDVRSPAEKAADLEKAKKARDKQKFYDRRNQRGGLETGLIIAAVAIVVLVGVYVFYKSVIKKTQAASDQLEAIGATPPGP